MKKKIAITMLIILVFFPLVSVIFPRDYSDYLQRPLKTAPTLTLANIKDGAYTSALEDFLSDRFAFKPEFLSLKAYTNLVFGVSEFDNIIIKSNVLFQTPLKNPRAEKFASNPSELVAIPYKIVYDSDLPHAARLKCTREKIIKNYINLTDHHSAENYMKLFDSSYYYKGDHHLNDKGVLKLIEHLDLMSDFKTTDEYSFRGGLSRKTGIVVKDVFKGIYLDEFKNLTATADGKKINIYNFDKLKSQDPYLFYIGGNYGILDIKGSGKDSVTIVKDSFANPLLPFFAKKYAHVRAIDARFLREKIEQNVLENSDVYIIGGF